jgi:hypothetical protein
VIDSDGKQAGIMNVRDAIRLAESRGLDLVEVAASAQPPVCRNMMSISRSNISDALSVKASVLNFRSPFVADR